MSTGKQAFIWVIAAIVMFLITIAILSINGCTDASWSQIGAYGSSGKITCYSGGKVIYEGASTGKIATEEHSDGWFFKEANTGNLIRVSGDCVIRN
jgi:hypothetical protein